MGLQNLGRIPILVPPCLLNVQMWLTTPCLRLDMRGIPEALGSLRTMDLSLPNGILHFWLLIQSSAPTDKADWALVFQAPFMSPQHHKVSAIPTPLRNQLGTISKEMRLKKYQGCLLASGQERRYQQLCPLKLVPKPQHQRRANILELYKRGYNIFSIVFEKGTVLMWLGHMKIIAGCRITKQELSAWTAVMKMFQKGEREKKKRKANYEWKKRRDESFLKLACLWSIHRCLGAGSATVPFCFSLEIQDMSISYPSW